MSLLNRTLKIFRKTRPSADSSQESERDVHAQAATSSKSSSSSAGTVPSEAPPAYSCEQKPLASPKPALRDPLEALSQYDTVFLVDDSGSMRDWLPGRDPYYNRWIQAKETCIKFASLASKYDADGIDIHFLNKELPHHPNTGLTHEYQIERLFDFGPTGQTYLGKRLSQITATYVNQFKRWRFGDRELKPRNYIILTDGKADDKEALASFIRGVAHLIAAKEFPNCQIGFQFVQVGDDTAATEFLQGLDDMVIERDLVDTVKYGDVDPKQKDALISKILPGGVNRFHDQVKL